MATWTRQELEERFPFETATLQIDNETRPMTRDEWNAWIEDGVGVEKYESLV